MLNTQTICILGVKSQQARQLVSALVGQTQHRVLLAGDEPETLQKLAASLPSSRHPVDIEIMDCMVNGCWEADIIVMDLAEEAIPGLKDHLTWVTNQKTIIYFSQSNVTKSLNPGFSDFSSIDWETWFPHSGIVRVFIGSIASLVESKDRESREFVMQLFQEAGLNPIESDRSTELIHLSTLNKS